jgi:SAM-dependent methyltransferase
MSDPCPSPPWQARELWASLVRRQVTLKNAASFIDPLITLLPRQDLDIQALARTTLLVLASQESTRGLFQQPKPLTMPDLQTWADPSDPAVHLFHLHLRYNLNTSLPLERTCWALLGYALDQLHEPEWWPHQGRILQPLLESLLQQWRRNGGVWPLARQAVRELGGLISQSADSSSPDELPPLQVTDAIESWCHGEPLHRASMEVARFYEMHPYPLWVGLDIAPLVDGLRGHLARAVGPRAVAAIAREPKRILVLGCGTGREALAWAAALPHSRVDGVDLSFTSLSHAKRKAQCLGISNVHWYQEDLLRLPPYFADYDLVTACGVLHHLPDPVEGVQVATRMVRPGGLIKLALYSEHARKPLVRAGGILRSSMAGERSPEVLALARARLIEHLQHDMALSCLLRIQEFFDLEGCWDLFFNPCETSFNLSGVTELLAHASLSFLGFEWDEEFPLRQFRALFPSDPDAVNLKYWACFEARYPQTFLGMFRFWCQRPDLKTF